MTWPTANLLFRGRWSVLHCNSQVTNPARPDTISSRPQWSSPTSVRYQGRYCRSCYHPVEFRIGIPHIRWCQQLLSLRNFSRACLDHHRLWASTGFFTRIGRQEDTNVCTRPFSTCELMAVERFLAPASTESGSLSPSLKYWFRFQTAWAIAIHQSSVAALIRLDSSLNRMILITRCLIWHYFGVNNLIYGLIESSSTIFGGVNLLKTDWSPVLSFVLYSSLRLFLFTIANIIRAFGDITVQSHVLALRLILNSLTSLFYRTENARTLNWVSVYAFPHLLFHSVPISNTYLDTQRDSLHPLFDGFNRILWGLAKILNPLNVLVRGDTLLDELNLKLIAVAAISILVCFRNPSRSRDETIINIVQATMALAL